ncbi:hypothetical protein DH2020_048710 [Rehmannia glutinosa]|uniref:Transcriptional regulator SLK2 n=1 Tax=Rehmannia glutinosa TaxID=99300 RepID=A0ABR0U5X0_REHGL
MTSSSDLRRITLLPFFLYGLLSPIRPSTRRPRVATARSYTDSTSPINQSPRVSNLPPVSGVPKSSPAIANHSPPPPNPAKYMNSDQQELLFPSSVNFFEITLSIFRVAGGMVQSSSSSGIFFQGDGNSQLAGNTGLSSNSLPGHARANVGPVSGDISNTVLNSVASSGPSVGASSLVTDANSGLSGGPHLQRSASINTESYMRLPASPISFSSNNISISGSSVLDGSSVVQQSSNQDPGSQQSRQHQGASSATSLPHMRQVQLPGGSRVPYSFAQDPTTISQLQKKPRLDIKQEDIVQQQVFQQMLQRQDPMHLQNSNPHLQALIQQQRLRQQEQQILQAMTPIQRVQFLQQQQQQQQQQLQLRQQLQVHGVPSASGVKRPYDGGVCSRRLMQYLYHQRQRPAYYSPRAKKRWCLSLYDNVGHHSLGVFPQAATILSWEFCARRHEELLPRRLVAPKVNQLLQVAQKCQSTISESGADSVSQPDLQANSALVVTAGRQLARSLELQSLNDLGFSKRYIADVVSSMKDLMDFCREQKKGPIEGLKNFPRFRTAPKLQILETGQMGGLQGLPTDRNTLNKLIALHPGPNSQHISSQRALSGSPQAALASSNYQNLMTRQNSMNSTNSPIQQEPSSPFSSSNRRQSTATTPRGYSGNLSGMLQNSAISGFSSQQQQFQLSQGLQQQMVQQYLHDMGKNNTAQIQGGNISGGGPGVRNSPTNSAAGSGPWGGQGQQPSRSNSFKGASSESESPAPVGHTGVSQKEADLPRSRYLSDEMVSDIGHEFAENEFFSSDFDDNLNFSWNV